jgi:hypothetical protein
MLSHCTSITRTLGWRLCQHEAGWLASDAVKVALQPEPLGKLQHLGACQLVGSAGCLALVLHPGREHGQ